MDVLRDVAGTNSSTSSVDSRPPLPYCRRDVIAFLAVLNFLTVALAFCGFLYVRSDISSDVQQKIDAALNRAEQTPRQDDAMTEEEAITEPKDQYANGNLDERELERALEDALTSDDPEAVVERYR